MGDITKVGDTSLRESTRILYIEPNDVYDNSLGYEGVHSLKSTQITPKYEDLCISFNLLIDKFSRLRKSGKTGTYSGGDSKRYSIQWSTTIKEMEERGTQTFLQGEEVNPTNNFLTTYYTEIDFDSYKEKTQIEGLGVESVQISYESWYTPTVVIKFVDIRGSALFGREEAIHVDEKMTVDNIFGAFFTMPYPRFMLQVKGFYGKPVTFQLTCSQFKGNLNSQTGNFEATVTFIAYSWSLMTEIPFMYLVAAPNATYIGADYWNRNRNKEEWQLWEDNGTTLPPPKLDEMFEKIKNATKFIDDNIAKATQEQAEKVSSFKEEQKLLEEIASLVNKFKSSLTSKVNKSSWEYVNYPEKKEEAINRQILLFSDSDSLELDEDIKKDFKDLYEKTRKYQDTYKNNGIDINLLPNKWTDDNFPANLTFIDFLEIKTDGEKVVKALNGSNSLTDVKMNDGLKFGNGFAQKITEYLAKNDSDSVCKRYAYLVNFYNLLELINTRISSFGVDEEELVKQVNDKIQEKIVDLIGFKPYIGNIFKIIFCHVETFCHILFDSADKIQEQILSNRRKPLALGIQEDGEWGGTDFLNVEDIGPWPAIYNKSATGDTGYTSNIANVMGWPGDFNSHNFLEEKVVYSLQEGIERLIDRLSDKGKMPQEITRFSHFPLSPFEMKGRNNPFSAIAENDSLSDLAGHLAIRAATILGVGCNDTIAEKFAEIFGRIDACNFHLCARNVDTIKQNLLERLNGSKLEDVFYGISICDSKYDDYAEQKQSTSKNSRDFHNFETIKVGVANVEWTKKNAHPMFNEYDSAHLHFVHWYDKNKVDYVPTNLTRDWKAGYKQLESKIGDNNTFYVEPKISENGKAENWLYGTCSDELECANDIPNFTNEYMFGIIKSEGVVNGITEMAESFKNGSVKAVNHELKDENGKLNEISETFFRVDKKTKMNFFYEKSKFFNLPMNKLDLSLDNDKLISHTDIFVEYVGKTNNSVKIGEEGLKNENDETISVDDVVMNAPSLIKIYGGRPYSNSLFTEPFFYAQNDSTDEKNRLYAKAILFLHALFNGYKLVHLNAFSPKKLNGCVEIVPKGYLLLIGALLWRQEQSEDVFVFKTEKITFNTVPKDSTFVAIANQFSMPPTRTGTNQHDYFSVKGFIGCDVDKNIKNQLVSLFVDFVDKEFNSILKDMELFPMDGGLMTAEDMEEFMEKLDNIIKLEKGDYDKKQDDNSTFLSSVIQDVSDKANELIAKGEKEEIKRILGNKYLAIRKDADINVVKLKLTESGSIQGTLKDLFFNCYCIYDSYYSYKCSTNDNQITLTQKAFKSYLKGFSEELEKIVEGGTVKIGGEVNMNVSTTTQQNRDLSISIYYYIKNLWDKWLCPAKSDAFDVVNFFPNFIFIDSFYRNTYNKLAINCQVLIDAFTRLEDNASLFSFIGKIITKHKCILLPVPDYIGFNYDDQTTNEEMMKQLFRPLPYNDMPAPSNSNKFVCIYTHNPATHASEDNHFKNDSFDIWSRNENGKYGVTSTAKDLFKYETEDRRENATPVEKLTYSATRYGYFVPSFGVSFARQQNHLFKNMNVTMDNPVMTEQAILAQWNIALKGSSSGKSVCFTGQDTFNVFTNYSYSVEVEMMGNAQICPLMYFQFLNVPMWRGTYMIYKVTHTMTPGNMITKFTGMKMSKYCKPFNVNFYTIIKSIKIETPKYMLIDPNCDDGTSSGDTVNGSGYTGTVTNEKAKKVLSYLDVWWKGNNPPFYQTARLYVSSKPNVTGKSIEYNGKKHTIVGYNSTGNCGYATRSRFCMAGVWSFNDGIWGGKDCPGNVDTVLSNTGFSMNGSKWVLIAYWKGDEIFSKAKPFLDDPKNVRPCDITLAFYTGGGCGANGGHACMWSGDHWVSDFWQDSVWVHKSGGGRGKAGIVLLRHAELQEPGYDCVKDELANATSVFPTYIPYAKRGG